MACEARSERPSTYNKGYWVTSTIIFATEAIGLETKFVMP